MNLHFYEITESKISEFPSWKISITDRSIFVFKRFSIPSIGKYPLGYQNAQNQKIRCFHHRCITWYAFPLGMTVPLRGVTFDKSNAIVILHNGTIVPSKITCAPFGGQNHKNQKDMDRKRTSLRSDLFLSMSFCHHIKITKIRSAHLHVSQNH